MKLFSLTVLLLVVFVTQLSAAAQSASFSRTDYPSLGNNHIAADLNGDALPDLAGTSGNSVAVMLNSGNGAFRSKLQYAAGGQTQDLAAGDFNSDGRTDLAVSLNDPTFRLSLLTGNGDGTFNPPVNFENSAERFDSPAIVATDLDNDGRLDVVLAHVISCFTAPCIASQNITVMLGLGDGTFQIPIEIDVGTGMSRIAIGDFNRDGIKDLAIAGDNSRVYTLLGIGNGSFLQQPTIQLTADTLFVDATDVDVADLNGDSIDDLVVAIPLNGSRTAILLGQGDGTFQTPRILTEPNLRVPQYQVIDDFNRDGFKDLAIALGWGTQGLIEIRNGNGDGTFRSPVLYFVPPPLSSVGGGTLVSADFNRDGRPDIGLPIVGANPALAGLVNSTGAISVAPAYGSVTATPSTIVSGTSTEIRITLRTGAVAPAGGLSFSIRSSNSTVLPAPSSVTMAAGSSSVRFNATARSVTSNQSVTISVSNNLIGSRQVSVTVTPSTAPAPTPPPATDTVRITRAEYDSGKRVLRVEATSTSSSATLRVFNTATGVLLGTLQNSGGGQYRAELSVSTNPQNITVRSSLGGVAMRTVEAR